MTAYGEFTEQDDGEPPEPIQEGPSEVLGQFTKVEIVLEGIGGVHVEQTRVWPPEEMDEFVLGVLVSLRGSKSPTRQIGFQPTDNAGQTLITHLAVPHEDPDGSIGA